MNLPLQDEIAAERGGGGVPSTSDGAVSAYRVLALPRVTELAVPRLQRALNVVIAALALVICAPLMAIIALLIKLTSPGPVIYTQTRVGIDRRNPDVDGPYNHRRQVDYGGRLFAIYKFRTMRADGDATVQVWAKPNDSRITPLGRVLRTYRLDELPQLVNVLAGDMSIVGPRPEQPKIFLQLREEVPGYRTRQRVLPGITGLAQVNHAYDQSIDDVREKLYYDLEYVGRRSVLEDLRIMVRTIPVVIFGRGAR